MHEEDFKDAIAPEYSYVFNFEKSYCYGDTQEWLWDNAVYCLCCGILYILAIIVAMSYMLEKPKYDLKRPLALWCGLMALFSIIGFSRTAPELFFALDHCSIYHSMCIPR